MKQKPHGKKQGETDLAGDEQIEVFTQTFASFNSTIKTLNESYATLQGRYQKLADELSGTNERLRAALGETERTRSYLEHVLESLTAGVLTIDLDGCLTSINRAGCQMLGVGASEVIGKPYNELFGGSLAGATPLTALLLQGGPFRNCEKRVQLDTHSFVPISSSGALIHGADGATEGALEVFSDLTEIKQMEEEIARVKSLAALGEVAAVIAHEVRNPLSGIGGFAALLERELGDEHPQIDYVHKITGGVRKLEQTVLSLLEYARDLRLDATESDLRELVKEAVDSYRIEMSMNGHQTEIELEMPKEKLACRVDREHLARAVTNLLQNAVQATTNGGRVGVKVAADSGMAVISVQDEGEPIPESLREKIFTPFFTTREGGTGLGLALVKKIVDAHYGEIAFCCGEHEKSFEIRLPRGE